MLKKYLVTFIKQIYYKKNLELKIEASLFNNFYFLFISLVFNLK